MELTTIIQSHRSIIVLNGEPPHRQLINAINTNVPIIAADGAANKMGLYGLQPTFIVGDGDSFQHATHPTMIRIPDQNTTDFEKCMGFVKASNLLPCLVLGINGGEIDHIVGNMQMLTRHAQGHNFYFLDTYTKPQTQSIGYKLGLPLSKQKLTLHLKVGCTISFMSFHETVVQTEGLEWELNDRLLSLDGTLSLRNRSKRDVVSFELKSGKALVVIDITDLLH